MAFYLRKSLKISFSFVLHLLFISALILCLLVHVFFKSSSAPVISVTLSIKFRGLNPVKQTGTAKANLYSCQYVMDSEISWNFKTI